MLKFVANYQRLNNKPNHSDKLQDLLRASACSRCAFNVSISFHAVSSKSQVVCMVSLDGMTIPPSTVYIILNTWHNMVTISFVYTIISCKAEYKTICEYSLKKIKT